ncbi:MAG TPA: YcaO-like family protein, partial [Micromonosporaceae bacterium]
MTATTASLLLGPGAPDTRGWPSLPYVVAVSGEFDADFERRARSRARAAGRPLLSIRIEPSEALIGPIDNGTGGACAGCAHTRNPAPVTAVPPFGLDRLIAAYLPGLATTELLPGDLVALCADGTVRRHRIAPATDCPVCGRSRADGRADQPPPIRTLDRHPATGPLSTRGGTPFGFDPARVRREVLDRRYGPVDRLRRKGLAAFAMTEARVRGSEYLGYGRGSTYRSADIVAVLEAYERFASIPREAPVVRGACRADLGDITIDPTTLGTYTDEQLASPHTRVRRYTDRTPMDWVWGHRLDDGRPLLVPAEIGFYRYAYGDGERVLFAESSSGSALGSSYPEAALHSLIELAERDA